MISFSTAMANHPSSILSESSVAFLHLEEKYQAAGQRKQEEKFSASWKSSVISVMLSLMSVARSCWVSIQRLRVVESVYVLYKGVLGPLTICHRDDLKCYLVDSRPLEPKVVFESHNC